MRNTRHRTRILLSFLSVIAVLTLSFASWGFHVVGRDIGERTQTQVARDLNSARGIYREEIDRIRAVVRLTAARFFLKNRLLDHDLAKLGHDLDEIREAESLDVLTLADAAGRVIIRSVIHPFVATPRRRTRS